MQTTQEQLILRWAAQKKAGPLTQYTRDIERELALWTLGSGQGRHVLDFGSESQMTRRLLQRGFRVTRADFTQASSDLARTVAGPEVRYTQTAPSFQLTSAETFDAIVSIGPFDFSHLVAVDLANHLLSRLVVGGSLIFSLPTRHSPYYRPNRPQLHFFTETEIDQLLRSLRVTGKTRVWDIFQPPFRQLYNSPLNSSRIPLGLSRALTAPFWLATLALNLFPLQRLAGYKLVCVQKVAP